MSDSKSSYNKTPEPIVALTPILTPGLKLELIPVFTESPTIAPNLRLPVSVFLFLIVVYTCVYAIQLNFIVVPVVFIITTLVPAGYVFADYQKIHSIFCTKYE